MWARQVLSPVRAAAAKQLARDPNPGTAKALVKATTDKNWSIRAAALEAISQRGDRSLVSAIAPVLDDAKDDVRFAAAACVVRLSEIPAEKTPAKRASHRFFTDGAAKIPLDTMACYDIAYDD